MTATVLITTGNGMFGRALIEQLAGNRDIDVRALVRNPDSFDFEAKNVMPVRADMDKPETLGAAVTGVSEIFLVTPMDGKIAVRERNVVDAALATGRDIHILKIHGAVEHRGDALSSMHQASIDYIRASGLKWTLISPSSVMETSLLPYAQAIKYDAIFGISGHGKVGFVALADVARATAAALAGGGGNHLDVLLTGPQAVDMFEVADAFSEVLGRKITYYDMTEDDFSSMMIGQGIYPDQATLEINVLCHYRAWGRGDASLVSDGYRQVTGKQPMSVKDWIEANADKFGAEQTAADLAVRDQIAAAFRRPAESDPGPGPQTAEPRPGPAR